jgi:undecaprenyl diphosphate synthase
MEEQNNLKHIAIIMDGNRRWAKQRNLPVKLGHKQGAETLKKIVRHANNIGVEYLTVYAFSTENWKRSEEEVSALMKLLESYLADFTEDADSENIIIRVLGDLTALSPALQKSIESAIERTKMNTGIVFNIALNYGGRNEIVNATKGIIEDVKKGKLNVEDLDESKFSEYLYTGTIPDPDLLIRTSGEVRLSGFLPWQLVYSEFLFIEKLWPDFTEEDLDQAIAQFNKRNRKFGAK